MKLKEKIDMANSNDFLNSFINENTAEYNILYALKSQCGEKNFLLQIKNISEIKNLSSEFLSYIETAYKSYELSLFSLTDDYKFVSSRIINSDGDAENIEFLINEAQRISKENSSFILVNCNSNIFLVHNGKIDTGFGGIIENKNALKQRNEEKLDINHLEEAFENYMSHKRYNGCSYVRKINGIPKVIDDIDERTLRNDLFSYLKKKTKLFVVPELCTSLFEDEESVDVALVNENNEMAIIEVKFFIKNGFFVSESTDSMYSFVRFKDGYNQLNRYCIHLDEDNNYNVRYAYLYMFYAHSDSFVDIKSKADSYCKEFLADFSYKETEKFRQHYKNTIFDNIVDIVV